MTDSLRVTCSCGCESRIPVERVGQTVICPVCGNDLVADGRTSSESSPAARPEVQRDTPRPAVLPPDVHTRSPFEADADEDLSTLDRLEAIRQRENRARRIFIDGLSQHDGFTVETCSQCGRELRGEWDRVETAAGVICYVCSNQGTQGLPERLKAKIAEQRKGRRRGRPMNRPNPVVPPSWGRWRIPQSPIFRGVVTILVCMFLAMALFYTYFHADSPVATTSNEQGPDAASVPTARDLDQLSAGAWVLVHCWMIVSSVLPLFFAIYFALFLNNSLPRARFLSNVVYVGSLCLPIVGLQLASMLAGATLQMTYATVCIVILEVMQTLVLVYIAFELLEESFWDSMTFVVVLFVLSQVAVPYLNLVMFRSLGLI